MTEKGIPTETRDDDKTLRKETILNDALQLPFAN